MFNTKLLTVAFVPLVAIATADARQRGGPAPAQTATDEYARYEMLAPDTASFRVVYEVSATTMGARSYVDPIPQGSTASGIAAFDVMTGAPLTFQQTGDAITVALARPVPKNGQGRLRIEKTYKNAKAYSREGDVIVFNPPIRERRASVVLPSGFTLAGCNVPSQVLSEQDGRIVLSFMRHGAEDAPLVVKARAGAPAGAGAVPRPLTDARSWEPPGRGPTERARLSERARQDRDIVYFLKEPSTNAFALYHDYTESRPGVDKYLNVVRTGSRVSDTSAYVLDTGEALETVTLKGPAITAANIDIGQAVEPETEVVVIRFAAVKPGLSVRLRISETYTAPQSYRLEGQDLVFERSLGRARNSVVLPSGWYLTASSIPAVVSETPERSIRLDFVNGRPDNIDVLIKARRLAGAR